MILLLVGLVWATPGVSPCGGPPAETAVKRFEEMLTGEDPRSEVAFASCLAELELWHSAQRHYLEVARIGPSRSAFAVALPGAIEIAEDLGDLVSVEPYMTGLRHRDLPPTAARDALLVVHATALLQRDKLVRAAGSAEEVSEDYPRRAELFLALGEALSVKGAHFEALQTLRAIQSGPLVGAARLTEARLMAELGRSQDAVGALSLIGPEDDAAADAAVRRAWLWHQLGDETQARAAQRDAVWRAKHGAFLPHADLLKATEYVADCRVRRATRSLDLFEEEWGPVRTALAAVADTGSPRGDHRWRQLRGPEPVDFGLPESVMVSIGAGYRAQSLQRSLDNIHQERERLGAVEEPAFRAIVGPHLQSVLDNGEALLQRLIGHELQQDLRRSYARIEAAFGRADALRRRVEACESKE